MPHVILESRWKVDGVLGIARKHLSPLHRLAQLIKLQSLLIFLSGDQPVGVKAGDIEPKVEITEPKDSVESILELLRVFPGVRVREETVHMQFVSDLLDVGQPGTLSASMGSKMRVDEKQSMSCNVQARSDATFVADPAANQSCGDIVLVMAGNQMVTVPMHKDCDVQTEQSFFDEELVWSRRGRLCVTGGSRPSRWRRWNG